MSGCQNFNNPNTQCNWHAKKKHSLARQESALTPSRLWSKRRATARQKNPRPLSTRGQQARVKTQKSENGGRKTLKLGFIKVNLKVLQAGVLCSVIALKLPGQDFGGGLDQVKIGGKCKVPMLVIGWRVLTNHQHVEFPTGGMVEPVLHLIDA